MSFKKIENDKISYIILPYNNSINNDIDINNAILKLKKKSNVYYEIIVGYYIN
jgi:prephenate dehydratase